MVTAKKHTPESWVNRKWRPIMGWTYMVTCITDFIIFPILWNILQAVTHTEITQWNPITLQGAGLFHIAMGAVLGISAYGRTQEKLGINKYTDIPFIPRYNISKMEQIPALVTRNGRAGPAPQSQPEI